MLCVCVMGVEVGAGGAGGAAWSSWGWVGWGVGGGGLGLGVGRVGVGVGGGGGGCCGWTVPFHYDFSLSGEQPEPSAYDQWKGVDRSSYFIIICIIMNMRNKEFPIKDTEFPRGCVSNQVEQYNHGREYHGRTTEEGNFSNLFLRAPAAG